MLKKQTKNLNRNTFDSVLYLKPIRKTLGEGAEFFFFFCSVGIQSRRGGERHFRSSHMDQP